MKKIALALALLSGASAETAAPDDSVRLDVHFGVAGCSARARRRKVLGDKTATITVGLSMAPAHGRSLSADNFYDSATDSLKESIAEITSSFEAACDCTVNVD